jgi:hypothetical protein
MKLSWLMRRGVARVAADAQSQFGMIMLEILGKRTMKSKIEVKIKWL